MNRAISAGGKLLSDVEERNWGDRAGYVADLDGHVVVFATKT
jgi:lactoylglutathione lyase